MSDVYVATDSAAFEYGGDMVVVHKGVTRVRAGHPILTQHPELFMPIDVHYDWPARVEQATAAPGEKRSFMPPPVPPKEEERRDEKPVDGLDALRAEAELAGVKVDKRWGPDKLRVEIAAAKSKS